MARYLVTTLPSDGKRVRVGYFPFVARRIPFTEMGPEYPDTRFSVREVEGTNSGPS